MWKNFLIAHPRNKRKQVQVFCWHNELPVEQVLCSTSLYPSKQNVIRHTPSISNFWKPRRAHSWFLKTLGPGPDHCTWTWAWPRQSFYVRTIASILSNAKISRDDCSNITMDLGEEGVPSDLSVGFQTPQCLILLWAQRALHPSKWPPPLRTSCGMHYRSEWDSISCPHCSWPNAHGADTLLSPHKRKYRLSLFKHTS